MASIRKRPDRPKPWEVLYRDPDGKQRSKSFPRKLDAKNFIATMEADRLRGTWVDPRAGKVTFGEFAEAWLQMQTFNASTREAVQSRLRNHLLPTFGGLELRSIRPSSIQAWMREKQQVLAPSTLRTVFSHLSAILNAALEDELVSRNPARSSAVAAPSVPTKQVVPWTAEEFEAVVDALPDRYRATAFPAAGCGLRQGEVFGLDLGSVQFLERRITLRHQVKVVGSQLVLAPPKGGKTRDIPLPTVVADELSRHLEAWGSQTVELPWQEPGGETRTVELIFSTRESRPINRNYFNGNVWKPALFEAGIENTPVNGMHALRHYYASVLLDRGVSIRALADYLGHADPGFTLRTYTHLMPENDDRAREAVDGSFGRTHLASVGS